MTDTNLDDLYDRHADALEEIRDDLERIANSGTPAAPRARNALEWLNEYQAANEGDEVANHA